MSILLSLSPFAMFFVLMRGHSPLAGLLGAFAVSLLLCGRMWWRGESLKILEVGSLVVFGALAAYTLLAEPHWSVATVRVSPRAAVNGAGLKEGVRPACCQAQRGRLSLTASTRGAPPRPAVRRPRGRGDRPQA